MESNSPTSDEVVEHVKRFVASQWERTGDIRPLAVVYATKPKRGLVPLATSFVNPEDKVAFSDMLRRLCSAVDAEAVVFLCEAWTKMVQKDDELPDSINETTPGAKEIVAVSVEHFSHRDARRFECAISKERTLCEWVELPSGPTEGRFANFLPGSGAN